LRATRTRTVELTASAWQEVIFGVIRRSGLPRLVAATFARGKVPILLYHDPRPEIFEQHLEYLARRYEFLPLARLVVAMRSKDWASLPRNGLVVTFDDGMRTNAALLDLFRRYEVQPTIFICSQVVATRRHFWFMRASDPQALKRVPNSRRLEILDQEGFSPTSEYSPPQALSASDIRNMRDHVHFGSHTRFHPILATCSDRMCREEIVLSRQEIASLTDRECDHFAYPDGDYTRREIEAVKSAGYLSGRTIDFGWNGPNTDPYRLRIIGWRDDASINRLAADLSGIPGYLSRLRRGSLTGRHRGVRVEPEPDVRPTGAAPGATAASGRAQRSAPRRSAS
jgi:peptidoglycan/xylan/chitin deacetylase (PgdA/CDA1 family)